ncbi:MAG: glycosyltransferase family protein [Tannerella sp.]|jgi:spore coat polysaccharide biosynthesis protein SpsF|nr:glycosyltransferase family protein [Tannerella sp.]
MRVAIIQARCGSTRFPEKIFADICGLPLIWHVIDRLSYCTKIDKKMIATTINKSDNSLEKWAKEQCVPVFRGSENDVLNRYYRAAKSLDLKDEDIIIRITADDPFKEPALIDKVIETVEKREADFAYNNNPPTFPEGLDCEVFTMQSLETADKNATDSYEREHVTQYMYRHPEIFKGKNISQSDDLSYIRLTLDTAEDYKMTSEIYQHLFKENHLFTLIDVLRLFEKYPEIREINSAVKRSDMYKNTNHGKNQ